MKDDSSEIISKKMLDWLTGITSLAAALSTIFSAFLSDEKKPLAYGIASLLVIVSGGIVVYQRRRAAKLKIAESLEPLSASAALRGLLPFEEGDQLPGRARDVQEIYTLVASSTFRFGVLWGESGCGKTSLLRAGLMPKLRNEKFIPLYINKPTQDPQEAIRSALLKEVPNLDKRGDKNLKSLLKGAAPKGKKIVILFDQFEEFFLTNRTPSSRAGFVKWLGEAVKEENLPVAFLLGIRADFFAQLQNFAPQIPEPTSTRSTYQLQNFDTEQAKQIFSAAAKADGIQFEPELIQAVIKELETEDFIRPAELQVVGTRLKRKNITRLSQYEALGGARGILSSYISEEIKQSANEQAARLVLRLMCADAVETKSPTDLGMDDILRGVRGSGETSIRQNAIKSEEIQKILNQFVTARVLIRTEENKYNLAHDYLAPYVRTATEGTTSPRMERANRLLKFYIAEYKTNPKTRIPFLRARWIQKNASAEIRSREISKELLTRSVRSFYGNIAKIIGMPSALVVFVIFVLSNLFFIVEDGGNLDIVTFRPEYLLDGGYETLIAVQTDFHYADLDPNSALMTRDFVFAGVWFWNSKNGYRTWGDTLVEQLKPEAKAHALRWLVQPEEAKNILIDTINDPKLGSDLRSHAISTLNALVQTKPEVVSSDSLQVLLAIIYDPRADSDLRSSAISALNSLAQANPQAVAVTTDLLQSLLATLNDPKADATSRSNAISALNSLAQARLVIVSDILPSIMVIINDSKADATVRSSAILALSSLAQANPTAVTSDMLSSLLVITNDSKADATVRSSAISALSSLAQAKPEAVTSDMLRSLLAIIDDSKADASVRSSATNSLSSLARANPKAVTSDILPSIMVIINDSKADATVRSSAMSALSSLAQAKPEAVTSDMLRSLLAIINDSKADTALRSSATYSLSSLAYAKPEAVISDMLRSLMALITDPQAGSTVRSSATYSLSSLANAKPEAVISDMLRSLMAIINDSKADTTSRFIAMSALSSLAQANPEAAQSLLAIVNDSEADATSRSSAVSALNLLAYAKPEAVTSDMLPSLLALITDPQAEYSLRSSATSVLSSLAQVNPEAAQSLLAIVNDSEADATSRSSAISALSLLAYAKPEAITSDMLRSLMAIINDSKADTTSRSIATSALSSLAQANPEAVTSNLLTSLLAIINDPKPNVTVRSSAMSALSSLAQAHPEAVTSDMLSSLLALITDPQAEYSLRSSATSALSSLAQANSEAVTSDMLQSLLALITDPQAGSILGSSATSALSSLAQANSEAVTSDMLQSLLALITDPQAGSTLRSSAMSALSSLAQAHPEAVTSDMLPSLLALITDPQAEYSLRSSATSALSSLAQANSEAVTSDMLQSLLALITDPQAEYYLRSTALSAINPLIETAPQIATQDIIESLASLCKTDNDSLVRQSAAHALFLIALGDPAKQEMIRDIFTRLQASSKPHWRMNGSRGLEMLAIGDLLEEARLHPERVDKIKLRLQSYQLQYDQQYYQLISYQEDDLGFAASAVLREIEKLEADAGK